MMIVPVILAGGSGNRLWPKSRALFPKQFLRLNGEHTMLQSTLLRLEKLDHQPAITICNEDHRFIVAEQLKEIKELGQIILEPEGRNTAPAVALAALHALKETNLYGEALMLILPADHVISDSKSFIAAIENAAPMADNGQLVTFGIVPTQAHTGYGYIKSGEGKNNVYVVDEFVEKPSIELAEKYVSSGTHYWNSGMFLIKASKYLEELKLYYPSIFEACVSASENTETDVDFLRIDHEKFKQCPSMSLDYAVMENTSDAVVIPLDIGWNDIGSWSSLWDIGKKDRNGNVVGGDIILHETTNSLISSDKGLVAAVGVEDLVIVATDDVVMVANKKKTEAVKILVQQLKNEQRQERISGKIVYRPWGSYETIDMGECYQVKRITVKPKAKLSLQKHHYRAEHWVVVSGIATVIKGSDKFMLCTNESTYIPLGTVHSLHNNEDIDLELIEVQSGSYLGEDDIIRFEDIYGRV